MKISLDLSNMKPKTSYRKKNKSSLFNSVVKTPREHTPKLVQQTSHKLLRHKKSLSNKKLTMFNHQPSEEDSDSLSNMNLYDKFKPNKMSLIYKKEKPSDNKTNVLRRRRKKNPVNETPTSHNTSVQTLHNILNNLNSKVRNFNNNFGKAPYKLNNNMSKKTVKSNSLANEGSRRKLKSSKSLAEHKIRRRDSKLSELKGTINSIKEISVEKTKLNNREDSKTISNLKRNNSINLNLNVKFNIEGLTNQDSEKKFTLTNSCYKPKVQLAVEDGKKKKRKLTDNRYKTDRNKTEESKPFGYSSLLLRKSSLMGFGFLNANEQKTPPYFTQTLLTTLTNKAVFGKKRDDYHREIFFSHFKETYLHYSHLNRSNFKDKLDKVEGKYDVFKKPTLSKNVLVLDLDETLVFCSYRQNNKEAIGVRIPGQSQVVG